MANTHRTPSDLDATQEMLRIAGDMMEVGILMVDRELRVVTWNAWLASASGIPASEVIGRPLTTLGANILSPAGEAAFARALAGGTVVFSHRLHKWLLRFPPPSGFSAFTHMQQSARIAPLSGADGRVRGAVAFIEDVTERVAAEDELRAATREAQAANKAKSDFLAAMSHELRTPIGAISGYADLLIEGIVGDVSDRQRDHLMRIKSVGFHLLNVVDEILTFARLEARADQPEIRQVEVCQVVREAASAVEPLVRKKGLELRVRHPDGPLYVQSDETKLRQIVINLLGNATKFTQKGFIAVEVTAPVDASQVHISVRDTGSGIAPDDIDRIFEPFVQARGNLSRSHEGTGLGLSVSRQLARLLGGDIGVRSEVGAGSTFTIVLPLVPTVVEPVSNAAPATDVVAVS